MEGYPVGAVGVVRKRTFAVPPSALLAPKTLESPASATKIQIDQLGVGLQSAMRNGFFSFYTWSGSVGREVVYFAKTESRYYRELQGEIPIDPAGIMYDWWFSYNQRS